MSDSLRLGSLCTGYGGLDMGVQSVLGGETVWVSDIDKGACKTPRSPLPRRPEPGGLHQQAVETLRVMAAWEVAA